MSASWSLWGGGGKYRLHHEGEVYVIYTPDGCRPEGSVNHVETDTEWCNQLVLWAYSC